MGRPFNDSCSNKQIRLSVTKIDYLTSEVYIDINGSRSLFNILNNDICNFDNTEALDIMREYLKTEGRLGEAAF